MTQVCCFEEDSYLLKCVDNDKICFVCCKGALELVNCGQSCKCYRQYCCFEAIFGCPLETAFVQTEMIVTNRPSQDGQAADEDLVPCL